MRNAFADQLALEAAANPAVCAVVADISPAGAMDRLRAERPNQFINVGVAEQAMVGIAAGMALKGMRPFCYSIAPFALERPWEFIRNDLAYQNLPVTIVGMGAGAAYATLGGTHQAIFDVALASSLPNMTVLAPCDPYEVRECVKWCANEARGPVYLRLGKSGEPDFRHEYPWEFGRLSRLRASVTRGAPIFLTYGPIASLALAAADKCDGTVFGVSRLKPLDQSSIVSLLSWEKNPIIVIEEHVWHGGLGQQVALLRSKIEDPAPIDCHCLEDRFSACHGTREEYLADHGLTLEHIMEAVNGA